MATDAELAAMRRAIAISAAGIGTTSPNPPVGCVILSRAGTLAGEGFHERKGEAHAETQALAAAGPLARGATAVVTLEPCNHLGRTPACRQALIDAGISRVVIALMDPTSRGEGGAAVMRAAGLDVEVGVLAAEARAVLGSWLTALDIARPIVSWPYLLTESAVTQLSADSPAAVNARLNADAILYADGQVTEAVPGSHGKGIIELKDMPPGADPGSFLRELYAGGVRRLVLDGPADLAGPFLAANLIDEVTVLILPGEASRSHLDERAWPVVPPGFKITSVTKAGGHIRVQAEREPSR
jgi:diaminohydroxyphosphoribosylaminopyrimidine deaminase / 5-amino-6-(5-phosphoribosylamino)uracil reductase